MRTIKKRDKQMISWMKAKRKVLKNISDGKERLDYFNEVVLPEMEELDDKEIRTWEEHRADFDVDTLERGVKSEGKGLIIPKRFIEACGAIDFEDIIFSKDPADIHQLTADRGLSCLLKQCTERQKELLFYMDIYGFSGAEIAEAKGVKPRNVTSIHARAIKNIRTKIIPLILHKFEMERCPERRNMARNLSIFTIYEERYFCATQGEDYLKDKLSIDLKPITAYFNAEPKRKAIRIRKKKDESKADDEE